MGQDQLLSVCSARQASMEFPQVLNSQQVTSCSRQVPRAGWTSTELPSPSRECQGRARSPGSQCYSLWPSRRLAVPTLQKLFPTKHETLFMTISSGKCWESSQIAQHPTRWESISHLYYSISVEHLPVFQELLTSFLAVIVETFLTTSQKQEKWLARKTKHLSPDSKFEAFPSRWFKLCCRERCVSIAAMKNAPLSCPHDLGGPPGHQAAGSPPLQPTTLAPPSWPSAPGAVTPATLALCKACVVRRPRGRWGPGPDTGPQCPTPENPHLRAQCWGLKCVLQKDNAKS